MLVYYSYSLGIKYISNFRVVSFCFFFFETIVCKCGRVFYNKFSYISIKNVVIYRVNVLMVVNLINWYKFFNVRNKFSKSL